MSLMFNQFDLSKYRTAAEKYLPEKIRVLFIAESPPFFADPTKMAYFFFERCPGNEMLFSTIFQGIFNYQYRKNEDGKKEFLCKFQENGLWLMDAVEYPINKRINGKKVPDKERIQIIRQPENYRKLLRSLSKLRENNVLDFKTKIILIKATVFIALREALTAEGHKILNKNHIGFPRYTGDPLVVNAINTLLSETGITVKL